ncbi:MAG TPA: hypothetical protein VHY77_06690, partial [Acidimicrobiales bacterium]|nr:hypothetical protein [Acidimicrobiales bacterium]
MSDTTGSATSGGRSSRSAMDRLLSPQSIVMVGASNKEASIGWHVYANLVRAFDGPVTPVTARD